MQAAEREESALERERIKDADPTQDTDYEKVIRYYKAWGEREKNGELLVRGDGEEHV